MGDKQMAETTSFRSAINGFNREDVVKYISTMLEKLSAAEKENEELQAALEEKTAGYEALMQERVDLSKELSDLKERHEAVEQSFNERYEALEQSYNERYDALEQSFKELQESKETLSVKCAGYEKTLKNNESKIGAAMLEAKRFSEMLVKEANDRAGNVYREAYDSVAVSSATAKEIDAKMKELSVEFDRTMGDLRRNMKKLIGSMRTFSDNAKDNGAKFLYQSEFSEEAE